MNAARFSALIAAGALLSACATTEAPIGAEFRPIAESVSILVMAPDVEVSFVTTGGAEFREDWTAQAKSNLMHALLSELAESGERVTLYDAAHQTEAGQQALLLNQAVTDAFAAHVVFMDASAFVGPLPHQRNQREIYTLGESARAFAPNTDAQYALFLTSRTQIESSGLSAANALVSIVAGYTPASANFRGAYVSLVDLRTGDIVWLRGHNQGDPRNAQEAASMLDEVFDDSPLSARGGR
jgi:hypothetical protein